MKLMAFKIMQFMLKNQQQGYDQTFTIKYYEKVIQGRKIPKSL